MAFFRVKRIKGNEYLYLVGNEWHKKSSRQKVIGYLGRIYRFELKNNIDFADFLRANKSKSFKRIDDYISASSKIEIIRDLSEWEIFRFEVNDFSIDLKNPSVKKNNKEVVVALNNGFLCKHTLKKLTEFEVTGDEQHDGYLLARSFVETGINVPHDVFVGLFNKIEGA